MIQEKHKLPPKQALNWAPEVGRLVHQIIYLKLLLWQTRGISVKKDIMQSASAKAQCTWFRKLEPEIILWMIRTTWKELNAYQKDKVKKIEEDLKELAETATGLSEGRTKEIEQIQKQKKAQCRYTDFQATLNRLRGGGLTGVDVPIHGTYRMIQGWEYITDLERLYDTVNECNKNHLHRDSETLFGNRDGYKMLHGADCHRTAKDIIESNLQ